MACVLVDPPSRRNSSVAFDVHISGVVAAVLARESGEFRVCRSPGRSEEAAAFASDLAGPVRADEAGRPGFVLAPVGRRDEGLTTIQDAVAVQ
jgi:hypothetical protein